jgi:hypothetical protein
MDVYMKYQAKLAKAVGDGRGMGTDDMKDMQKVQKDMEAELASIMSPEDYREYQLRMSQTAMTMRMQLGSFEPSQKEFDKIFDARKAFDDEHGLLGGAATTREERDKRAAAQKEMNDQLKAVLGEERYAEYERAQDWNYQSLYRVTERYDLPKEAANKVYDMQKVAQQEAGKIRSDSTLSAEQKKQALADVRAETEKSIQVVLPEKAWDSYRPQAYWLNSISAEPRSTEAAPTP